MKLRKLKYVSCVDNTSFDIYFTAGKVYLERKCFFDFSYVKCDNGDIKLVPLYLFKDVTEEVDKKFNKFLSKLLFGFLIISSVTGILLHIFVDQKFLMISLMSMLIYLLIINKEK